MQPDPSSDSREPLAAVLSMREQWRLLLWMEAHPAALAHNMDAAQSPQRHNSSRHNASGRAPLAYVVGVAVGMVWVLLKRAL